MASGDIQERIETVLSEHRLNVSDEWCTAKGCEWNKPWGTVGALESMADHRAHVAAMLAPLIREAKAEALREAADLLAPNGILWWGDLGVRVSEKPFDPPHVSLDDWLRARADKLVTDE